MAGDDQSDPFLWDEDRVVRELCTSDRSWKAPQAGKVPDPASLEARLREYGVDGESLLTYLDEFDAPQMWQYLGIKQFAHQRFVKDAINQLRRRSPQYQEWKAQRLADHQLSEEGSHGSVLEPQLHKAADQGLDLNAAPDPAAVPMDVDNGPRPTTPGLMNPSQGVLSPALSASAPPDVPVRSDIPVTPEPDHQIPEGPPNKRRRVAPTVISTERTGNRNLAVIPTEGDFLLGGLTEDLLTSDDPSGFLGMDTLPVSQLTDPQGVDETDDETDEELSFIGTQRRLPPGRRIQVAAVMKRFLRSHPADRVKARRDEDDEIIPLFGESGDENDDPQTWLEYQEEEKERLAREARRANAKKALLGKEELADITRNVMKELESRWLAEKKPKCDRKAWKIWQNARRNLDRLVVIGKEKRHLQRLEGRIASIVKEFISEDWTAKDHAHRKAAYYLERSVFDKWQQLWLIDVLQSPRQPPKPAMLPRLAPKATKPMDLEEDEELSTSDDDDMGDFIEHDGLVIAPLSDEMEVDLEPQTAGQAGPGLENISTTADEAASDLPAPEVMSPAEQAGNALLPTQPTPKKIKAEQSILPITPSRTGVAPARAVIEIDSSPSPVKWLDQIPNLENLESLEKIGDIGTEYWEKTRDPDRLVVAILCGWSRTKLTKIYAAIVDRDHTEAWTFFIEPALKDPTSASVDSVPFLLCRLFDAFVSNSAKRVQSPTLRPNTCRRMEREGDSFTGFYTLLGSILPIFLGTAPRTPSRAVFKAASKETATEDLDLAEEELSNLDDLPSDDAPPPSTRKRRRPKRLDQKAATLRKRESELNKELERRRNDFHARLAEKGGVPGDKPRLIVNDTKASDELGLIYINDHIGSRIKDHQIDGVRFMWNQVVVDSSVRQGCLLAHTMGLGKTMQVITLLVVIAEASASPDESVRSQIPESLRESKTLVLCPASIVDNWADEFSIWAPDGVLGPVRKLDASLSPEARLASLQHWASSGGVLLISYKLFTTLINNDDEAARLLHETPNLVVGDEAHYMKNPDSLTHQATAKFTTMSRIAMTGSPLTNNVMDYYAMINWVAPNYLADLEEFRQRFSNPIKEGFYTDSDPYQKRKARRMLHVLKATVDPKVHRRDIHVLHHELPQKKEFIITLPLTKLQLRLYKTYIRWVTGPSVEAITGQARVWSLVATLARVLAHPFIFKAVAEAQQAKAGGGKAQSNKATKAAEADDADEQQAEVELPQNVLFSMLADVAVREIEDYTLSNKIVVLLRVLEECKKVGDKVLVFSQSIPTLDYVENIFKRQRVAYQRLDGNTPVKTRQDSVKKFNADVGSEVYLISTTAGGVGLNIHGANRVVIFDFKYTPANEQQAIGRAYRIRQTKPVFVYWLTVGGTFEDTIHNQSVFKSQLASRVVDKKNPDPWSKRVAEYFAMPKIPDQADLTKAFNQDHVLDALLNSEDVGPLIRKITSTETFEKEETYELTPEEKREADEDIAKERLRIENPEEYQRREYERAWQSRRMLGMPPPPPSSFQGRPADGESQGSCQSAGHRSYGVVKIKVPEHLREKRNPGPPVSVVVSGAEAAPCASSPSQPSSDGLHQPQALTSTPETALVNPPPPPFQHHTTVSNPTASAFVPPLPSPANAAITQSAATPIRSEQTDTLMQGPQPILGAGSHFKIPENVSPSALPPLRSVPGEPTTPSSSSPPGGLADIEFPDLIGVHQRLCEQGRHARCHPRELITRVNSVLKEKKTEQLPWMDKIQNLKKCTRNARFAEAMLSGYLPPEQLASLSRPEMKKMMTTLNCMTEAEFQQRVWTTTANLNQTRTQFSSKTAQQEGNSAVRPAETNGSPRERGLRRGVLRFITSPEPEEAQPATPQDRRGGAKPGDSAATPQVID